MNIQGRFLIAAVLALFALGFFANSVVDHYTKPDRPVLSFVVRAAKLGLWLMMFAETGDTQEAKVYVHHHEPTDATRSFVSHSEGW